MRKESRYGLAGVAVQSPSRHFSPSASTAPALGAAEGEKGRNRPLGTRRRNKGGDLPSQVISADSAASRIESL